MGRWADIVTNIRTAVGSTAEADAQAWALSAARTLNAEAEYLTAQITIGTTTAGTSTYALGDTFIDLAGVRVGGYKYDRVSPDDLEDLLVSEATVSGTGRVYTPSWSSLGAPQITLYPAPEETGLTISGRQVIPVPTPTWATHDPPLPQDFDSAIEHGAIAKGLALKDEDLASAQWHEDRFWAAVPRLRKRRHSRVGSGPVRLKVSW